MMINITIACETGPPGAEKSSFVLPLVCGLLVGLVVINLVGCVIFMVRRKRNETTKGSGKYMQWKSVSLQTH